MTSIHKSGLKIGEHEELVDQWDNVIKDRYVDMAGDSISRPQSPTFSPEPQSRRGLNETYNDTMSRRSETGHDV